jgi:hypothetical protein
MTQLAARGGALLALFLIAAGARADEVFYRVRIDELKLTSGKLPEDTDLNPAAAFRVLGPDRVAACAVLDGEGEAYVHSPTGEARRLKTSERAASDSLVIRVPGPGKITGTLYWPRDDMSGMVKLTFVVEDKLSGEAPAFFFAARQDHYAGLMKRRDAGAAWFRHQFREAHSRLKRLDAGKLDHYADGDTRDARPFQSRDAVSETFGLMSGGRAVSDNLQLDRLLPPAAKGEELVDVDSIKGISVAEIDWKPLIKDMQPATDPLARLVPADQHLLLFPNSTALLQVVDRLAEQGTIVMHLAQPQTGDPRLLDRYARQLGLSLEGLARMAGPAVVGSVALTGSDPNFESGTDVALVFETAQPAAIADLLVAQLVANAGADPAVRNMEGKSDGLAFRGVRTRDRRISSLVAVLPGAVLLTNSNYQIERFAAVARGDERSVASLDEFTFFRNRYPRGDKQESALLFISDATIRRWCGPRWRIGASRVTRNAAVLAELDAAHMDELVKKQVAAGPIETDLPLVGGGDLTLSADGVQSSGVGHLGFMTPIGELKIDKVSEAEAKAYGQWRDGYQTGWRWAFDPIALRLGVRDNHLAADLTVTPLIAGNEYRHWIDIARGATIAAEAGDRHNSIIELILAINTKNEKLRKDGDLLFNMGRNAKLSPLLWLGQSISIYLDYDSYWNDLAACKTDQERWEFFFKNLGSLPVAVWFEVADGQALKDFLVAAEAFAKKDAPAVSKWEPFVYRGQAYTKISADRAFFGLPQLFYFATDKSFLLTPNEAMLKRAINRHVALEAAGKAPAPEDDSPVAAEQVLVDKAAKAENIAPADLPASGSKRGLQPWLGTSVGVQLDHKLFALLADSFGDTYQQWMQMQSWSNLPILNEWHRLYPDEDPLALHERIWHTRLVCPGGGRYVWNEAWQTMESTVYGHPGDPKTGPTAPPELLDFRFANFGLSFEGEGLRARSTLDRKTPAGKTAKP